MEKLGSKILVINIGSASKKYSIFDGIEEVIFFHFEKHGNNFLLTVRSKNKFEKEEILKDDYEKSLEFLDNYLSEKLKINNEEILALSFRVVAPGSFFLKDSKIDDEFLKELKRVEILDTLHISPVLDEINNAMKIYSDKELFAISDSAFHKNKLEEAKYYGIPKEVADQHDFKRFGYHGISVESVINTIRDNLNDEYLESKRILICHLGGGVSFTAVVNGKSLDNSMGFSPLEGPPMATRAGNVDDILLGEICDKLGLKTKEEKIEFLSNKSGLLGLSGISSDLRILREEGFKGNKNANFAIRVYVYNIKKEISKMISVMNGVDTIVFTGTIGFRADFMRELILDEIKWLGFDFDLQKNSSNNLNSLFYNIESKDSEKEIIVCETNEMFQIAKNTLKILK